MKLVLSTALSAYVMSLGPCAPEPVEISVSDSDVALVSQNEAVTKPDSLRGQFTATIEWSGSKKDPQIQEILSFESTFQVPESTLKPHSAHRQFDVDDLRPLNPQPVNDKGEVAAIAKIETAKDGQPVGNIAFIERIISLTCIAHEGFVSANLNNDPSSPVHMQFTQKFTEVYLAPCQGSDIFYVAIGIVKKSPESKDLNYEVLLFLKAKDEEGVEHYEPLIKSVPRLFKNLKTKSI